MAVDSFVGWASHVNRVILSQTTFTIGDGATKTDELEGGGKKTRLKGAFCADKYSVVMEFNCDEKVSYTQDGTVYQLNKTELQLFWEWYKYKHQYGTIPFEFPKIIYSPQSGIKSQDDDYANTQVEYYKITSAVEGTKTGHYMQVKMTWESVYGGVISIPKQTPNVVGGVAYKNHIDIYFSVIGKAEPTSSNFSLYKSTTKDQVGVLENKVTITGFYFDGVSVARLYYSDLSVGTYYFVFSILDYDGCTVNNNTATVTVKE